MAHAHLPPKIPNSNPTDQSCCWVDEFLDFSLSAAARASGHRRSISDSLALNDTAPNDDVIAMFLDATPPPPLSDDRMVSVDHKRVKRIFANRQSAQRSRVKKLRYISDLERALSSLQAEVSLLSPRVAFLDQQRLLLNMDNTALKQRIAALAQDKVFKDAQQEELRREIWRLQHAHEEMKKNVNMEIRADDDHPHSYPHYLLDALT